MEIRLATSNKLKIKETIDILKGSNIIIGPFDLKIEELQTFDVDKLVKDKLLKAFSEIGRPVIVEHTGLYIKYLNDFPGGLTQIFWDSLGADKLCEITANIKDKTTIAKTTIGYCDGSNIHLFKGEVAGTITSKPKGNRDFQWDCIFVPKGHTKTFAEMGNNKNLISMRKIALENFRKYIETL